MDADILDTLPPRPVLAREQTIGVSRLCDITYPTAEHPDFDRVFDEVKSLDVSWDAERHIALRELMGGGIESIWSMAYIFPFGDLGQRDKDVEIKPMSAIDMQYFRRHCPDLPQMSDQDAWKQFQLFTKSMYGSHGDNIRIDRNDKFLLSMIGRLASSHESPYSDRTCRFGQYIAIGLRRRMPPKDAYTFGKQAMAYDEAIEDLAARVAARAVELAEIETVSLR
jgi:hypothetical protein